MKAKCFTSKVNQTNVPTAKSPISGPLVKRRATYAGFQRGKRHGTGKVSAKFAQDIERVL